MTFDDTPYVIAPVRELVRPIVRSMIGAVHGAQAGGAPTITGIAVEGQLLTASTAAITDANGLTVFTYQWLRAGVDIPGATGATYTTTAADIGYSISVRVSYTNTSGTPRVSTSLGTAAIAQGPGWLDFSVAGNYLPLYSIGM